MPSPLTRRFAVLLVRGAPARRPAQPPPRWTGSPTAAHGFRLAADANAPLRANRLAQVPIAFRGGPITTSTGETVDVRVSDALPLETSTPEGWAEFLSKLTHGPEIASLTTYIVSFDEVQQICGSRALGCYGQDEMVAPGELAADIPPEEVVRHEYGHHIAFHRLERAVDCGRVGAEAVGERGERLRQGVAPRGVSGRPGIELRPEPG